MKKVMGAVLAVLAGCSSMVELRDAGPYRSFHSSQATEKAAECVLFAWQNQSLAGVHYDASIQPLPGGGRTVVSQGQVEFADIRQAGAASEISVYFQSGVMDWRKNQRLQAVKGCL